jgi:hypothetical protein
MGDLIRRYDPPAPSRLTSTGRSIARIANHTEVDMFEMDCEAAVRRRAVSHSGVIARQTLGEVSRVLDVAADEANGDPYKAAVMGRIARELSNDIIDVARGL